MMRVANAGVLYVWFATELSRAIERSSDAGIQRLLALISRIRSMAAGEHAANHKPPSEAKHFCGAK
jgi:hypothetical protein